MVMIVIVLARVYALARITTTATKAAMTDTTLVRKFCVQHKRSQESSANVIEHT